jgi:predicted dehydrogenase
VDLMSSEIGVGLVGYRFMGRAHSNAYRQGGRFFDLKLFPGMRAICARDEAGVKDAARAL